VLPCFALKARRKVARGDRGSDAPGSAHHMAASRQGRQIFQYIKISKYQN
jgi:hypothetical protein